MKRVTQWVASAISTIGVLIIFAYPIGAQAFEAPFYAGKRLTLYVAYAPGGAADLNARLVARHLGNFIPGNPRVLVKNMPGAGGIVLANYLYNVSKPDGLEIGTVGRTGPISRLLGRPGIHFDAEKFTWIGSPSASWGALFIRGNLGIKTVQDLKAAKKEVIFLGLRPETGSVSIPRFFREFLHWPIRPIPGYPSAAAILAALERKEGDAVWLVIESLMGNRPDLVQEGFLTPILQTGPYFPGVSKVDEVLGKLPSTVSATYDFLTAPDLWGWAIAGPPGIPKDRAEVLAESFMRMARSEVFVADAKKLGMLGTPLTGDEVEKLVRHIFEQVKTHPDVVQIVEKLGQ